ncbi:MAG: Endoribonuclease [Acidobacteriaceae bacterium]|nr:Endoribonuclease [Acidobacteriaceae bacterium]
MKIRTAVAALYIVGTLSAGVLPSAGWGQSGQVIRRVGPENARISSVVWVGDTLYVSGTMAPVDYPADRAKGTPAGYKGDTRAQAIGAIRSIEIVLKQQGLGLGDIVQMQAFLVGDPAKGGVMDRDGWDAAYSQFFGTEEQPNKPVRATVQVSRTVIPTGLIEIMVVAARSRAAKPAE